MHGLGAWKDHSRKCAAAQLLKWILGKVKQRGGEVDTNKQYTSELLAILMQHSEANQQRLGAAAGIDTILQAISYYKNRWGAGGGGGGGGGLVPCKTDSSCCCKKRLWAAYVDTVTARFGNTAGLPFSTCHTY